VLNASARLWPLATGWTLELPGRDLAMANMTNLEYDKCYLASRGYKCEVGIKASYRGSPSLSIVVTAEKDGQFGFVFLASGERAEHFLRIRNIQHKLPAVAKIVDVIENRIFVVQRAPGTLLWHIEDGLPKPDVVRTALDSLVESLEQLGLVHGDLRPWNVFYDLGKGFTLIDWGFSFFLDRGPSEELKGHFEASRHHAPFQNVDRADADRITQLVQGKLGWEDAWGHPDEVTWGHRWAKRKG
jgi:hypothetical protein